MSQLAQPFDFLKLAANIAAEDVQKRVANSGNFQAAEFDKQDEAVVQHKFAAQERAYANKFETQAKKLYAKSGRRGEVPWFQVMQGVLAVYLVLTVFSALYRPNLLGSTVCAVAILMVSQPDSTRLLHFRALAAVIVLTWVYDFVWLFFLNDAEGENQADGG